MARSHSTPSHTPVNASNGIFRIGTPAPPAETGEAGGYFTFGNITVGPILFNLLRDKYISGTEFLILAIIEKLSDNERRVCWANNNYIAKSVDSKPSYVSNALNRMKELGIIDIVHDDKGGRDIISRIPQIERVLYAQSCGNQPLGVSLEQQGGYRSNDRGGIAGATGGVSPQQHHNKKKGNQSKTNTVPNRPAAPASPPQPTDVGTMSHSTKPKKSRQPASLPHQQDTAPVVDRITYTVPHQPVPTPVVNETTEVRFVGMDPDEPGYAELMASVKTPLPVSRTVTPEPKPQPVTIPKPKKSGGLLEDVAPDDSQERAWAVRLRDALSANGKLTVEAKMTLWKNEFVLLLKAIKDAAEIERVLTLFIEGMPSNWGNNQHFPIAYSAAAFREKFPRIVNALKPKPLTEQQQRDLNMW
jgi:DNA-binding MarR family transcriptional regulator